VNLGDVKTRIKNYLPLQQSTGPVSSDQLLITNPQFKKYAVGNYSYGCPAPRIIEDPENPVNLKIGKFCSFGPDVTILLGHEHKTEYVTTFPFNLLFKVDHLNFHGTRSKGDVVIGNDVWVGFNALILSGVQVGDGAVIGANAVVSKDVEPYSIVAGNPAVLIRKRFDDETVKALLRIKWWDWPFKKIRANLPLIMSANVSSFIEKHRV
jgi:acetyltransferase-like isoleucine patch superfamily enzyme